MSRKKDEEIGRIVEILNKPEENREEESNGVVVEENGNDKKNGVGSHNNHDHDHHQSDEEKRQLLVEKENVPIQVQVISAACQSSSTGGIEEKEDFNGDVYLPRKQYYYFYSNKDEGNVKTALLTLLLVLFNLLWSATLSYWHFQLNHFDVAATTLVIIALSGSTTSISFFTIRTASSCRARRNLWRCSRVAWLLAAVPCLEPVILAAFYFISSVLDKASRSNKNAPGKYEEQQYGKSDAAAKTITSSAVDPPPCSDEWRVCSGTSFLTESLTLCFPMCVLHLCVLLEDSTSIPSFIGLFTLFGLFLLSFAITFSRFQFDCLNKRDRFGEGTEKYLRFCYLWSAKIIWLVTYALFLITARMRFAEWKIEATIGAVALLTALHEIPLWICLLPHCGKLAAKLSSLFFLIPQFTSLLALIYWVNTDPEIYHTNIASIILGVYFWSETVMLCGWLVDGSTEKDVDLVPLYPHFFGDVIASCFPEENNITSAIP